MEGRVGGGAKEGLLARVRWRGRGAKGGFQQRLPAVARAVGRQFAAGTNRLRGRWGRRGQSAGLTATPQRGSAPLSNAALGGGEGGDGRSSP